MIAELPYNCEEKMMMRKFNGWYWYSSGEEGKLRQYQTGKWMYFFDNQKFAMNICKKAMDENVCYACKCTDLKAQGKTTGVVCFYQNFGDIENHKRILEFMIRNGLIQKTKNNRYHNISFKMDEQTLAGEYGKDFKAILKLDYFIDLYTGEWIDDTI